MSERVFEGTVIPEVMEGLKVEIDAKYEKVFATEEAFNQYFFATSDSSTRDLQIRLGVFIKRILGVPSERFWLMRRIYRNTELPPTSIHRLDKTDGFSSIFALNGYTQTEIDAWNREQPTEIQKFFQMVENLVRAKLELPAPQGEEVPKVIHQYSRVSLSSEEAEDVLRAVLPEHSLISLKQYSDEDKRYEIETPLINFNVYIWHHEVCGYYFGVGFPDEPVVIEPGVQAEFNKYHDMVVVPILLRNVITHLPPDQVTKSLSNGNKDGIFEGLYVTPGVFHGDYSKPKNKNYYYAWGRGIDLSFRAAQQFGLIPEEISWMDHTFVNGHFLTVEQLWHALFNTPYPGEVKISEAQNADHTLTIGSDEISATHQKVINSILADKEDPTTFIAAAENVIKGYRFFTKEDLSKFTLPEGFQPIAVAHEGNFAIGFKQLENGVELCYQVPNETLLAQIEDVQKANRKSIQMLEARNEELERLKGRLSNNET